MELMKGEGNPMYGLRGIYHPAYGYHHTKEMKERLSIRQKGENAYWYGKSMSIEMRRKMSKAHEKEKCHFWKGGKSLDLYCRDWTETKREEIRKKYNRKCYACRKDEINNIDKNNKVRRLSVHHIDNDKEQGCNGKKWKLVPLCMDCHLKLHYNKIYLIMEN